MKLSKTLFNLSTVSLINFVNMGLGLIFFTAVAKALSLEDLGVYSLITLLLVSLSKLIDFGSNSSFVSDFISRNKNYLNEFLNFKFLSFIITSIVAYIFLFIVNRFNSFEIYLIFISGLFFYMWNYLFFALFQKEERFLEASLLNFFPALIKAIFGISVLTNILNINLITALTIFSISMAGSFLIGWRKIPELSVFKFNFKILHFVKNFYQAGISQFLSDSLGTTASQITKFLRDLTDLGTLSLASKLSNVFSTISYSIFTVILATNSKRKLESKLYNLQESIIIGGILFMLAVLGSLISPFFFSILFGDKFNDSIVLFNVLLFAGSFTATHRFLENYFYIEQKTGLLLKLTALKMILLISLSIILINYLGLLGVVIADLIASIITCSLSIYSIKRNNR